MSETDRRARRILVTGSRHWIPVQPLRAALDAVVADFPPRDVMVIVHGGADGADRYAGIWAKQHGYVEEIHHPKPTGERRFLDRDDEMVWSEPELVVAFRAPGKSNGTDYTVRMARKAGLMVQVHYEADL